MGGDGEVADVGVAGLPEHVDLGWEDVEEAGDEGAEGLFPGAEGDHGSEQLAVVSVGGGEAVEHGAGEVPAGVGPAGVLGVAVDAGDALEGASGEGGAVDACARLDVGGVDPLGVGQGEEGQRDPGAGADDPVGPEAPQDSLRPGDIGRRTAETARTRVGHVTHLLALEQPLALP